MSFHVVGLGEVLWDVLPEGKRLGGAPANFACHALALGADACVISAVGRDALGEELLAALQERGFAVDTLSQDSVHATGTVTVAVSEEGQPSYTIHENAAWDHLVPTAAAWRAVAQADAVCFGSLAQRHAVSRKAVGALLDQSSGDALKVFDVNLRQAYYDETILRESLQRANVAKVNEDELPIVGDRLGLSGENPRERLEALVDAFALEAAALTCGAEGSLLVAGDQCSWAEGVPVEVRDTIGAGDSFLAGFVMGLLLGKPLDWINAQANALARHVCTCEGATPALPEAIRGAFSSP
jgi:fructokinase